MARVKQSRRTHDILRERRQNAADAQRAPPVRRVWSLADEVRILEGLAAHVAIHGKPPGRKHLRDALKDIALDKGEYTLTEIYEKVRRLKGRYFTVRGAGEPTGGDAAEARKYELSSGIWGDEEAPPPRSGQSISKVAKKHESSNVAKKQDTERRDFQEMRSLYPYLSTTVEGLAGSGGALVPVLKRAFEYMEDHRAADLEDIVKKQRFKEAQLAVYGNTLKNQVLQALLKQMD